MSKLINLGLVSKETRTVQFGEVLDDGIIKISGKCYNARLDKNGLPFDNVDATSTSPVTCP